MTEKDFSEVTVKEAAHDDAGRGIARVSIEVMKKLGLVSGDVIEIQGKKKAAAIVWPGFPAGHRVRHPSYRREYPGEPAVPVSMRR